MSSAMRNPSRVVLRERRRQFLARREGRAVHDEVETAELLIDACEHRIDVGVEETSHGSTSGGLLEPLRQVVDVLLEASLIGERQPRAAAGRRLRDRPGDRALVGDTDDQSVLAREVGHRCVVSMCVNRRCRDAGARWTQRPRLRPGRHRPDVVRDSVPGRPPPAWTGPPPARDCHRADRLAVGRCPGCATGRRAAGHRSGRADRRRPPARGARPPSRRAGADAGLPVAAVVAAASRAPLRLAHREVGGLALRRLPFGPRQRGANQRTMDRAVVVERIARRLVDRVRRVGGARIGRRHRSGSASRRSPVDVLTGAVVVEPASSSSPIGVGARSRPAATDRRPSDGLPSAESRRRARRRLLAARASAPWPACIRGRRRRSCSASASPASSIIATTA